MDNYNQTPPPIEIHNPPNIKESYKKYKKNNAKPKLQKIRDINSKNQKKKKAKQLSRQLFKMSKKINTIL